MRVPRFNEAAAASLRVWPLYALRSSLSLRTAVVMTAFALVTLLIFSIVVSERLTSTIFDNRRTVVLEDAAVRYSLAHATMQQSTATTPDQVQDVARQVVENIQNSAASNGAVAVVLLRSPDASTAFRVNEIIPQTARDLITPELRRAVDESDSPQWQSVALDSSQPLTQWWRFGADPPTPGIVTGTHVHLPRAGAHELYIVYSLAADQAMVSTTMEVLLLATLPILILLPFVVFWGVYRLLGPVQRTARAASSLAEGNLDVRVPVEGSDEMARLSQAFNDMATSLQTQITEYDELAKLQQRFVSDVSHELRTPLTTIRMAEEMIWNERDELSPVSKRSAELLHGQVERFDVMLADLLEISRLDAQSAQLEAENTDIRPIVTKVVDACEELANHQKVTVRVDAPTTRLAADIDERRIERVLRNLIVNAIEHAEHRPVDVTLAGNDRYVAVRVRDYGVGMTADIAARVFDRFYRADPARARTTGGTGLGLSIAQEDVHLHGGVLRAHGELGEGSSFLMVLPRSQTTSGHTDTTGSTSGGHAGGGSGGNARGRINDEDLPLSLWEEDTP